MFEVVEVRKCSQVRARLPAFSVFSGVLVRSCS